MCRLVSVGARGHGRSVAEAVLTADGYAAASKLRALGGVEDLVTDIRRGGFGRCRQMASADVHSFGSS